VKARLPPRAQFGQCVTLILAARPVLPLTRANRPMAEPGVGRTPTRLPADAVL